MPFRNFTKLRICAMEVLHQRTFSAMSSPRVWRVYDDGYVVRNPCTEDIDIIKSWRLKQQHPIPNDLAIVHRVLQSKPGIYVGEYQNQLVSCTLVIKWGDVYNASYLYVLPEYRSKNFGWRMFDLALGHANGRAMLGDSNKRTMDRYIQDGWKPTFRIVHYEGRADKHILPNRNTTGNGMKIVKGSDVDFEKLMAYDRKHFTSTIESSLRKYFVKEITFSRDGSSYVALDKENEIVGIGYQRACVQENIAMVGPIYADTTNIAEMLLRNLLNDIAGQSYNSYVYEPNSKANDLFKRMGAKSLGTYQRINFNKSPNEYKNTVICYTSPDVCHF